MNQDDLANLVYLGLGSNLQPEIYLQKAVRHIGQLLTIEAVSSAWQSEAVGTKGPDFLNAVLAVSTDLSLENLKSQVTSRIEEKLERVRTEDKYAPRTIDIDVLVYKGQVVEPEVWLHAHHAVPLAEIAPYITHPDTGEPISTIADRLILDSGISHRPDILTPGHTS